MQIISLRLQIGLQTSIGMNCLNIKILIVLIGVFLINTQPFITTAFSLKKVKAKNVTLSNPWITKGLLKSVRKKNSLYKPFLAKPTAHHENLYKCYKNKLTHSLRVAKRLYYNKKLCEYKYKSRYYIRHYNFALPLTELFNING